MSTACHWLVKWFRWQQFVCKPNTNLARIDEFMDVYWFRACSTHHTTTFKLVSLCVVLVLSFTGQSQQVHQAGGTARSGPLPCKSKSRRTSTLNLFEESVLRQLCNWRSSRKRSHKHIASLNHTRACCYSRHHIRIFLHEEKSCSDLHSRN